MTGKEKLCHVVHWLQFFLSFEVLPRHLWNLRHIANNIFYPYPRLRISFPEKNPSIAARLSAWKDRIECVSGNSWNKLISLYCSLNSPKFLWCRSDREEYVSFVDLCNLYRSFWSFNLRLPFKKEDGDQWSSCAGKVSVFHLFVFLVANFARFTWQQLACNSVAISLDYWRIKWYWKSGGY